MNLWLWILQILLALYNIIGGGYMLANYKFIAVPSVYNSLPQPFWIILGILQILFGLGLVLPKVVKSLPKQTIGLSAAGLAIISLLGIWLYEAYSGFPGM